MVFDMWYTKVLVYAGVVAMYNLYFHPLSGFPGPILARSSLIWRMYHSLGGRFHRAIDQQHRIYGPVIRVSPNELSFSSVSSLKTIYGHPPAGQPMLLKSEFYDMYDAGFNSSSISSESNPEKHRQMQKSLSAAFSHKALMEQESIVAECVERFVAKIGDAELNKSKNKDNTKGGLDMTKWYEMVAFDILGELAFGESFHSIENGKPHFWSELIENHVYFISLADNFRRLSPLVTELAKQLILLTPVIRKHLRYTRGRIDSRLSNKSPRRDIMTALVEKVRSGKMDKDEMTAHASTLVIAGGETMATFLAAITFYLLKGPKAYNKLREEIRSHFKSYDDICAVSAQQLPYLQAVIKEGLRIYPPGSQGFPRISPGVSVDGYWVPQGTELYTSAWTITHDPRNFHDPYRFKPERWLDPQCTDNREASQPFLLGPRACLGRNVANMQINLILTKMLWKYDMELVNNHLDWQGESRLHVLWSKPELRVRFSRCVDQKFSADQDP
ncbi:hypothetical protein VTN00DRAFT_6126 [Thermoascus crustaceus]|uniref:uncharacterized protein n=1 Tax=Thermoascus crustaceus TaxID=5088 RepID=UPI00374267A6